MIDKPIIILAIESSCDETSASIIIDGIVKSNVVAGQEVHSIYGGVVPEYASRAHQLHIVPVIHQALTEAGVTQDQLSAIAYTKGPGLLGALLVGHSFAKGMAMGLGIPLIGVNHMQAHILAHFIDEPKPEFPFLCLTVSGGHTQLVSVKSVLEFEIIGETNDDAVGEAFDKAAKTLGLGYPGGPLVDKYAKLGNPKAYKFPIPEVEDFNFSFSGIKTAFLYFARDKGPDFIQENLADVCASVQYTLVEMLMKKLIKAAKHLDTKQIAIAGGVSANSGLRTRLQVEAQKQGWKIFIPAFEYCTDNAAMVAMTAHFLYQNNQFSSLHDSPMPRLHLNS
jgi:N6-L-threonylcarbamoyladenine synthase